MREYICPGKNIMRFIHSNWEFPIRWTLSASQTNAHTPFNGDLAIFIHILHCFDLRYSVGYMCDLDIPFAYCEHCMQRARAMQYFSGERERNANDWESTKTTSFCRIDLLNSTLIYLQLAISWLALKGINLFCQPIEKQSLIHFIFVLARHFNM